MEESFAIPYQRRHNLANTQKKKLKPDHIQTFQYRLFKVARKTKHFHDFLYFLFNSSSIQQLLYVFEDRSCRIVKPDNRFAVIYSGVVWYLQSQP